VPDDAIQVGHADCLQGRFLDERHDRLRSKSPCTAIRLSAISDWSAATCSTFSWPLLPTLKL